jgi:hypothetical protein
MGKDGKAPPPEQPSVQFMDGFAQRFEDAWAGRKKRKALSSGDLTLLEEYRLKGYSDDEAIAMLVDRRVANTLRDRPQPRVRERTRPQSPKVQPVATERDLPRDDLAPTPVARKFGGGRGQAAAEEALFGTRVKDDDQ